MKTRTGVPALILVAGLLVLALLLAACGEQLATPTEEAEKEATPTEEPETVIPDTTQVLSPAVTGTYLTSIEDDGERITFAEGVLQKTDLSVGNVLAIEPTELAPDGLLRRVVQVTTQDGQVQVQTVQATLEEAIETGFVGKHITLTPNDVRASTLSNGVSHISTRRAALADKFILPIDETLAPGVRVKGEVTIEPSFDFIVAFDNGTLKHLTIKNTTTQTGRLELITTVASVGFDERVSIASETFKPLVVSIGPVPIWLTPQMNVYVGVDGQLSAQITAAVEQDVTFETGFVYDTGQFKKINNSTGLNFQFDHPTFSAGAEARTYVRPQLDVLIYGVTGPYVAAEAYVKLEAGPTRTPLWEITGGVRGVAGVKVKIVSSTLAGYDVELVDKNWPIMSATQAATADTAEPPPTDISEPTPTATLPPLTTPAPPPNVQMVYNDAAATAINISSTPLSLVGVTFNRVSDEGTYTAEFAAGDWGTVAYYPISALPAGDCYQIQRFATTPPTPPACDALQGWLRNSNPNLHFWVSVEGSDAFRVLQNNQVIDTCRITEGKCLFYLPQP